MFLKRHSLPLLFIIGLGFSLHFYFLKDSIPFLSYGGDPFDQYVQFQRLLYTNYRDWNLEWSWLHGLGGDIFGQFIYYYATSFFFLIKLLFPMDSYAQLAEVSLYISIAKTILAGAFFYFYMVSSHKTRSAALLGALVYIGSIKLVQSSFFSEFMADAFVFIPLVLWGLDRLLKQGKPVLFIVMTFCIIQSNFYFAYITTIYLGLYTIVFGFTMMKERHLKDRVRKMMSVALAYLTGLLLASYSFIPAVYQFLHAYRFSKEYVIPILYPIDFYMNMPVGLFFNITTITIPAFIVLLLLASVQFRKSIPATPFVMALLVFVFYQIPYMYSVFNGFSAMESRWVYILIFALAVLVTYVIDEWIKGRNISIVVFVLYYSYLAYSLFFENGLAEFLANEGNWFIIGIHLLLPLLLIYKKGRSVAVLAMSVLLFVVVSLQQNSYFILQLAEPLEYKQAIVDKMKALDHNDAEQEVIAWLQENDSTFSRYERYLPYEKQISNFTKHNRSMVSGLPSLSSYHSLLSSDLGKFIYEDFQIKQFDSFSHYYNVDERLYIQAYLQANYVLVDQSYAYIPRGYSLLKTIGTTEIYKLDTPMPFAYVESNAIHADEYDELSIGMRDMLLLQAYHSESVATTKPLTEYDLPTTLFRAEKPFQQSDAYDINDEVLMVNEETEFTIPLDEIPLRSTQVLATFTLEEVDGNEFTITIGNTRMEKRNDENTYSLPIKDFTMHLDEELQSNELTLRLTKGTYRLSDMHIEMLPTEQLATYSSRAVGNAFDLMKMEKNKVVLSGEARKAGKIVTSIPYSKGWKGLVDGKRVNLERINEAFVGIPVNEGDQQAALTYHSPFLRTGLGISFGTLIAIVGVFVVRRRRG